MKICVAAMEYDYGDITRARSYDYWNFYQSLVHMGHDVHLFDYMVLEKKLGRVAMNVSLINHVVSTSPDLVFFIMYTDQFNTSTIDTVRKHAKTLGFFHDATWRQAYVEQWAAHFDWFSFADSHAKYIFNKKGLLNSLHLPYGVNETLYQQATQPKTVDVSFVGGWDPYRQWLVNLLRKANIKVEVAGYRWPEGVFSHEAMVSLFGRSKISLNLSNSNSWDIRYLLSSPHALVKRIRSNKNSEQLKARHFEIAATGTMQLSYYVEGLERYYEIGKEIAIFLDPDELVDKVRFYLADDFLREQIACRGLQRTLEEHTYFERFQKLFAQIGFSIVSPNSGSSALIPKVS